MQVVMFNDCLPKQKYPSDPHSLDNNSQKNNDYCEKNKKRIKYWTIPLKRNIGKGTMMPFPLF